MAQGAYENNHNADIDLPPEKPKRRGRYTPPAAVLRATEAKTLAVVVGEVGTSRLTFEVGAVQPPIAPVDGAAECPGLGGKIGIEPMEQ
jgi:hypothetical protein